jgi:hypothetical protein
VADIKMGPSATSDVADLSPFISHTVSFYHTVLRAGTFDMYGVLSTNVDRKKGYFDPFPLALLLSYVMFCLILFYYLLFYSILPCHFVSRGVSCCTDSYRIVSVFYCSILYAILRNAPL